MPNLSDTIAAIATPIGIGAIAVIRVSGGDAISIADSIFKSPKGKRLADSKTHRVYYGKIVAKEDGKTIDEVMALVMRAPNSFTGEDTVEITTHGGIKTPQMVLTALYQSGARPADSGEFTKRAFLNGKLDLSQAEAVIDLINSKTALSAGYAVGHLEGRLSKSINDMRERLLNLQSHILAFVDFPEDDIDEITLNDVKTQIVDVADCIKKLLLTADFGQIVQDGIKTTIAGKPNVGKSSLLNAFLGHDRSIVTDVAGTTRDVVEACADIKGIPLLLSDTAGISDTSDMIEKMGTDRSRASIQNAQLVLLVLDLSRPLSAEDKEIISLCTDKKFILVLNKDDLEAKLDLSELPKVPSVTISAKTLSNLDALYDAIFNTIKSDQIQETDDVITNERHKASLFNARMALSGALLAIDSKMPLDMISIDLHEAISELGSIIGQTVSEEIVNKIFSRFCLGK